MVRRVSDKVGPSPVQAFVDSDLEALGQAVANLENAIDMNPGAFHAAFDSHIAAVGDGLIFALAMKGFVVTREPALAAEICAAYEQSPRLS